MEAGFAIVWLCVIYIVLTHSEYVNGFGNAGLDRYNNNAKEGRGEVLPEITEMRLGKFLIKLIDVCDYMNHMTNARDLLKGEKSGNESKRLVTLKHVISAMTQICFTMYGEVFTGAGSVEGIPGLAGTGNNWLDEGIKHMDRKDSKK